MKRLKKILFRQMEQGKLWGNGYIFAHRIKVKLYKNLSDESCLRRLYKEN